MYVIIYDIKMNRNEFIKSLKKFNPPLLISNDCSAAYIYSFLNIKFPHPFIWCDINAKDFIDLMQNFNNINYNNIEIVKNININNEKISISIRKDYKDTFSIIVDDKISVNYIHHHINNSYKEIYVKKYNEYCGELYYYNVKSLLTKTYNKRNERMIHLKQEPIFIIFKKEGVRVTDEELYDILTTQSQYKRIFCIPYNFVVDENVSYDKNLTTIIKLPKGMEQQYEGAKYLIKNYAELLNLKELS